MQIDKIMCVLVSNTLLRNVYLSILLYSETADYLTVQFADIS